MQPATVSRNGRFHFFVSTRIAFYFNLYTAQWAVLAA